MPTSVDFWGWAIVELGRDLSPSAEWTLTAVAGRMAQGASISQAGRDARLTTRRAKRQLEELGEELTAGTAVRHISLEGAGGGGAPSAALVLRAAPQHFRPPLPTLTSPPSHS
jgi:hypothetical protein